MPRKKADKSAYDRVSAWVKSVCPEGDRNAITKFAKSIGATRQAVENWRNGVRLPDPANLLEIKKKYGINIDAFLTGESSPAFIKRVSEPPAPLSPQPSNSDPPIKSMPPDLQAVYPDLEYIFSSKNPGVKQALSSNIREFKESVIKDEKAEKRDAQIAKLEEDVRELKNRERQDCSGTQEKKRKESTKKKKAM